MPNGGGVFCELHGTCRNVGRHMLCTYADEDEAQKNCTEYWPNCGNIAEGDSECGLHGAGKCQPDICEHLQR